MKVLQLKVIIQYLNSLEFILITAQWYCFCDFTELLSTTNDLQMGKYFIWRKGSKIYSYKCLILSEGVVK